MQDSACEVSVTILLRMGTTALINSRCDEGGPPCDRCKIRGTACEYPSPKALPAFVHVKVSPQTDSTSPAKSHGGHHIDEPSFPPNERLLELQLMHRWSAITYKCCTSPGVDDDDVWQLQVPELSLRHDFLLYGVFALAALETAGISTDHSKYVDQAVKYHSAALASFREQLPFTNNQNHEAMLCFSLMLMVMAIASAQVLSNSSREEPVSMIESTITHFELIRGAEAVVALNPEWMTGNPYVQKMTLWDDMPRHPLEPQIEEAIKKLSELNDRRIKSSAFDSNERRVQQIAYWEACKTGISMLQDCFSKCVGLPYLGYALGWPNLSGAEYIQAIKDRDRVALLLLMHWGVLMETIGQHVWWAQRYGVLLGEEITDRVSTAPGADLLEEDIIQGAKKLIWAAQTKQAVS